MWPKSVENQWQRGRKKMQRRWKIPEWEQGVRFYGYLSRWTWASRMSLWIFLLHLFLDYILSGHPVVSFLAQSHQDFLRWPICIVPSTTFIIQLKGSVKEPNMFHKHETEKITRKASDVAENLQLYRVVRFFRPRSSYTTHLMLFSERPPIYASRMTISRGRTEQHVIIGFAVD